MFTSINIINVDKKFTQDNAYQRIIFNMQNSLYTSIMIIILKYFQMIFCQLLIQKKNWIHSEFSTDWYSYSSYCYFNFKLIMFLELLLKCNLLHILLFVYKQLQHDILSDKILYKRRTADQIRMCSCHPLHCSQ